ncbi:MAG: hypothetical protein AAF400_01180 [Bacteroidota bacterium]
MKRLAKRLRSKAFFPELIQPLSIIVLASLVHFECGQALNNKNSSLILEITSDISKLPNEGAEAFVASVSRTTVDPTGCYLVAIQELTYEKGAQKLSRKVDRIIPLETLIGSEEISRDEGGKMISFALRNHEEEASTKMVAYSLLCYIANNQFDSISDHEKLEWSLIKNSSKEHFDTFSSRFQSCFMHALANTLTDKLIYPVCKSCIFEPIKNLFFKPASSGQQARR